MEVLKEEFNALESKCEKSLHVLLDDLAKISATRASATALKPVIVQLDDGAKYSVLEVAVVRVINARTLGVKPWDAANAPAIERAVKNIGLMIGLKDDELQVSFPELTQERRKEIAKSINVYAINAKNAIRDLRHHFLKTHKPGTKEEEVKMDKDVQKIIDKFNSQIDTHVEKKQKEIIQM